MKVRRIDAGPRAGPPDLSVVVPLYDEQEVVGDLYRRTVAALEGSGLSFEVVPVDDGSTDRTPELLDELRWSDPRVRPVRLSRNFGHQAAICAGLDHARGRAVVVMDGDLQDPPELIPQLVARWRAGAEVVYAVRRRRAEPLPKRLAYRAFYRLLRALSDLDMPLDSGDFCLMDRRVVDALKAMPERLRFVRGLRTFVGFRQEPLPFDRPARAAGRPKYTLPKLVRLAADGLVNFSSYPLQVVTYLGLAAALGAAGLAGWVFWDAYHAQTAPRGWASTIVVVLFMNAVLMINQGLQGAYLRRLFLEAKGRPTYIVRDPDPRPAEAGPAPAPAPHFGRAREPRP